jgi:hypothetical protein
MKWIYRFFVVLGVIFFFILLAVGYFIVADPLNLRPVVMSLYEMQSANDQIDGPTPADGSLPTAQAQDTTTSGMSDNQVKALEAVGIAPESVPSQFTPEQTACFTRILGEQRVNEIKAGGTPTPAEYYKAKECI